MSDCPHSDVDWDTSQAEENEQDVFTIPGVCADCGESLVCRATIDEWWEENEVL